MEPSPSLDQTPIENDLPEASTEPEAHHSPEITITTTTTTSTISSKTNQMKRAESDPFPDNSEDHENGSDEEVKSISSSSPIAATSPSKKPPRKGSLLFKAKKNMIGKAATSGLGKQVLMKMLDEETSELMQAIKLIFDQRVGKKKATELHNNVIKIVVKIQFQFDKRNLSPQALRPAEVPLRKALRRMVSIKRTYNDLNDDEKLAQFLKVERHVRAVGDILMEPMQPYLTPKNLTMLKNTIDEIGSHDFWMSAYSQPDMKEPISHLCRVMNRYIFRL
eukprot:TRINITY_DN1540_c0_g1_i1.p1 TRINITY_DN1540_c0_g1~~TRINITY_DN1540_c0_g1_i1.p1  ORF type:complete len:278 (-),score=51.36 TRINITY_DN1540_c0_g1_i1:110-943(-)